jgi:HSP20 family protein
MNLLKRPSPAPLDLWEAFDGLRGEMDRAMDLFRVPDAAGLFDHSASPAVDVMETADEYLVVADVPGVKKEDLEISLAGTLLSIKGEKKGESDSGKRKVWRKETWLGSFHRTIDLPVQAEAGQVSAELKDGVLAVRIAKREEAKRKLISVQVK